MHDDRQGRWLLLLLPAAALALWAGWSLMFFVCDDAYIAFRYVSSRQLGWGYTWNPPPFAPVEGYTSFLWVVMLDALWTLTGQPPPETAPVLGLFSALGTVFVTTALAWSVPLSEPLTRWRPALVALVLVGVLTNKTFLAWTSSGLEAPLAVLLEVAWFAWAAGALRDRDSRHWILVGFTLASLTALCRPDGLLQLAATPFVALAARLAGRPWQRGDWMSPTPTLAVVAHLVWRQMTYGQWLPNTWFAKVAEPWPDAGFNHLAYWIVENGLFFWLLPLPVVLWRTRGWRTLTAWRDRLPLLVAVATVGAHAAYYVLKVGGDHFEFRIYAHLPPLLFVGALAAASTLTSRPWCVLGIQALLTAVTWPIAWTDHIQNSQITDVEASKWIREPVADDLWFLGPWATAHDELERMCIRHKLAMPHQTHKHYRIGQGARFLSRADSIARTGPEVWDPKSRSAARFPITAIGAVGLAGWRYPYVAIIDKWGLSDRVIARNYPVDPDRHRYSAHDRYPPPGYADCFRPNTIVYDKLKIKDRDPLLSPADIRTCERDWLARILEAPLPPPEKLPKAQRPKKPSKDPPEDAPEDPEAPTP